MTREAAPAEETEGPVLLELPPDHGARLRKITRELVRSLCHVDRMYQPHQHNGTWWLRLRDPFGPMTLLAADFYLLRRVEAMEQLMAILDEEEEAMEDAEYDDAEETEHVPLFVWGRDTGPGTFGPMN